METKILFSYKDAHDSMSTIATWRDEMLVVRQKASFNNPAKVRYKLDNKVIIQADGAATMCSIMKIENDKLLTELANRYNYKAGYDDMVGFLFDHKIPYTDHFPIPKNMPVTTPVTLYHIKEKAKEIHVTIRFDNDDLLISKYHLEREYFKHFALDDYTWENTVRSHAIEKLYELFDLWPHNRPGLLTAIASKFNSPECFTEVQEFLKENEVEVEEGRGPISWF